MIHISPLDFSSVLLNTITIIAFGTAAAWFYRRGRWKPILEVQSAFELPQHPKCRNIIHIKINIKNIGDTECRIEKIILFIEDLNCDDIKSGAAHLAYKSPKSTLSLVDGWWVSVPGSTAVSEFLHQSAPDAIAIAYGAYVMTEKITTDRELIVKIIEESADYFYVEGVLFNSRNT